MKKHLCLICTVIIVVLTTLLSGCNDGNLSETSSVLTSSESTSSIFINSDNTSSEKVNSNFETSSKTSSTQKENTSSKASSTQKEETSSSNSTSTTSKISVDRTPTSQNSSKTSSKETSSVAVSSNTDIIGKYHGINVISSEARYTDYITKIYNSEIFSPLMRTGKDIIIKETGKKITNIKQLNEFLPIEILQRMDDGGYFAPYFYYIYSDVLKQNVVWADGFYFNHNGTVTTMPNGTPHPLIGTKAQFETLSIGDTMKDVLEISPSLVPSDKQYNVVNHFFENEDLIGYYIYVSRCYTTDGYRVTITYDDPTPDVVERDMEFFKTMPITKIEISVA